MTNRSMRPLIFVPALLAVLGLAATPAFSQAVPNETDLFVGKINAAAHALGGQPKLAKLSEQDRQKLTEFVVGNMLFVILHELGHAAITQLSIPVLGKPEDLARADVSPLAEPDLTQGDGSVRRFLRRLSRSLAQGVDRAVWITLFLSLVLLVVSTIVLRQGMH